MKKLLSAVLAAVMLISLVTVGATAAWADAPAEEGKVFAGYYTDDTYTESSETETAYPKFVDENVLTAKYQLTDSANEDMDSLKIRVVTTVDSLNYQAVGFHVWVDGVQKDVNGDEFRTTRVSTTIKGTDGLDVFTYTPDVFSADSMYFCAYNFTLSSAKFGATLTFQPYWITKDGTEVTGNSGAGGDGKRDIVVKESESFNNILIGSASELYDFAAESQSRNYEGWKVKLTADIDLNPGFTATTDGFTDGNDGTPTQWTSIGSTSKYFKGVFDGQGHTISGLYQNSTTHTGNLYLGLFAATSGVSTVKNFRLENSYIYTQGARSGSIAGDGCGNFENIYSDAILVTEGGNAAAIGGMIGFFDGSTGVTYSGLHFAGTVTGSGYHVGGILGRAANGAGVALTLENCRNSGTVSSSDVMAGGMVGLIDTGASSVTVNITGCWNSNTVYAKNGVQGTFVGKIRNGTPTVNITDSLNSFMTTLNPVGSQETGTVNVRRILSVRSGDIKIWPASGDATSVSSSALTGFAGEDTLAPYGFDFETAWAVQTGHPVPRALANVIPSRSWYVGDGPYVLNDAGDLCGFTMLSQTDNFEGKTIMLGADIDLNPGFTASTAGFTDGKGGTPMKWTSIGSTSKYFKGTFDGQDHTISGLYQATTVVFTTAANVYLGLFAATSGVSTVKNFRLENSYIYSRAARIGSIAGNGDGNFENIYSNAILVTEGGYAAAIGGMIGYFDGSTGVAYSGLHFDGTLTGSGYHVGGILGRASNSSGVTLTLENCRNSGTVSSSDTMAGGMVGLIDTAASSVTVNITGCWNGNTVDAPSARGTFVGKIRNGAPAVNITDSLNSFTTPLNPIGSQETGSVNYRCVLDVGRSPAKLWDENGTVNTVPLADLTGSSAEDALAPFGFDFENAWVTRSGAAPAPKYFAEPDIWSAAGTEDDPYVISTADDLRNFAEKSQTDNFEGKIIKLGADIDLNPGFTAGIGGFTDGNGGTPVKWTSIGSTSNYFKGTFDGQGHTISGLYQATTVVFTSAANAYLGLFAATSGVSTVKNFRLENSYIYSRAARVGSIAGNGDGNFENIYSNAILVTEGAYAAAVGGMIGYFDGSSSVTYSGLRFDGTLTGSGYHVGGILGRASNGAGVALTIENCRNSGAVSSSDTMAGGIVGLIDTTASSVTVNIAGCWNSNTVSAPSARGTFVGKIRSGTPAVNITDCLNSFTTALNPIGSQETGTVNYRCVLDVGRSPAKVWDENGTSSSVSLADLADSAAESALAPLGFDFDGAWAIRPGATPIPRHFNEPDIWFAAGTEDDPYVISTAANLREFAERSQTNSFAGKTVILGADIDLNPGWTADVNGGTGTTPAAWTPVGPTSNHFKGTFDGRGHTISGLYLAAGAYGGLFGSIGDGGTVQNLRLTNSALVSDNQYLGSIAGQSKGTIRNVYSSAAVQSSKGRVGGLVGIACGENSVLEKCWFDGTVTNTGSTSAVQGTGGLVGYVHNDPAGSLSLRNCLFSGTVDVSAYNTHPAAVAGGLIGYVYKNTTVEIDGCLASGSIVYDSEVVTGLVGPIAGIVEDGACSNVLLLSRTYAVDTIPSLSGTHVVSGDNFNYDVPVADSFVYVSASAITGAAAQTAMPLLDWGTDWKYVAGHLPEIDFDHTAGEASLAATSADAAALNSLYAGRTLYQGELHDHADTSVGSNDGTSDGYTEVTEWYDQMETLGLDFAASLDHQQTSHINSANWDKSKLIYGSEASTNVRNVTNNYTNKYHYSMLFRTQAQFESVLNAFSAFKYGTYNLNPNWTNSREGRTNNGKAQFTYPNFSRAEFASLIQTVQDAGGFFVLPHAFSTSENNTDAAVNFNFGVDGVGFELIYAGHSTDNHLYATWKELLASGAKMYACAGTDGHRDLENTCLTSVYGASAAAADKGYLIDQLRAGDFTAGSAGIKMCVGSTAMGGTCSFSGRRVVVDVTQIHALANDLSHNYRLDVINDKGVVCSVKLTVNNDGSVGSGAELAFDADASSAFYRVVVVDCNTRSRIAIGNPIWNMD